MLVEGRFGGASLLMDGGGVLVEGAFGGRVFRWRRCVGGRGVLVLVERAFWWSEPFNGWRGRFGGRSILVEGAFGGRSILVEGVVWWRGRFGGKSNFGGEGGLVQGVWWRGRFGGGMVWWGGVLMWKGRLVEGAFW